MDIKAKGAIRLPDDRDEKARPSPMMTRRGLMNAPTSSSRFWLMCWTTISLLLLCGVPFAAELPAFGRPPKVPHARAHHLLARAPVIDGHIDLPILARALYENQLSAIHLEETLKGQVDIQRLRRGRSGGFFWSVFVPCPEDAGYPRDNDGNFTTATWRVRDTLEQIDIARLLINKYSDSFTLVETAQQWRRLRKTGRMGAMLGVEGGHQLGSTLSSLRLYYDLGARYVSLTHTCHNALADSCGQQGVVLEDRWHGVSPFGRAAIREMNRLGMMVDLSHSSPKTANDALSLSLAPVIFSHSNARGVHDVVRNVPDDILRRIGRMDKDDIPGGDTIIMLNFAPAFISETTDGKGPRANVKRLADHADYIGRLAGRQHVGIGSDFDGIESVPEGLEDVSYYPALFAELIKRNWTDEEIQGVSQNNILRVMQKVEDVSKRLKAEGAQPETVIFEGRDDLPVKWRRSV